MGRRNVKKEELNRLRTKSLDAQFCQEIVEGLNCSRFESEAILEVVKEIYFPYLESDAPHAPPGKISLVVVSSEEPAGKPLSACKKQPVCLTVHQGAADDVLLQKDGAAVFRQSRIPELCQEALSQGGLLTREDLAYRIFFVSPRTITRDLGVLRQKAAAHLIPLRSTVHDIGPVLSHRVEIVRLALQGRTATEICRQMRHSPSAVNNYLSTFIRCLHLKEKGLKREQIAYLLHRGESLIDQYLELADTCRKDKTMRYHLEAMLEVGQAVVEKKWRRRT